MKVKKNHHLREYRELEPVKKIVFTWNGRGRRFGKTTAASLRWNSSTASVGNGAPSTHEKLPNEIWGSRYDHTQGWNSVLDKP